MGIVMRCGMATMVSVFLKEVMVKWSVGVMMGIMVGFMMHTVLWEVLVIIMIAVSFPASSMVIVMGRGMVVTHIVVLSIAIVVMGWSMSIMCIMVVDSMGAKMGINTVWIMDWGVD